MDKEVEQRLAKLKEQYKAMPPEKRAKFEQKMKKKNFLNYKKIELVKADLLRLEARRAQLELCDREKELEHVEHKIRLKKEKLLRYLGKQLKE